MGFSVGGGSKVQQKGQIGQIGQIQHDETVLFDDFEAAILAGGWNKNDVAGTGTVARDATTSYAGTASIKITTGAIANNETYTRRYFKAARSLQSNVIRTSAWLLLSLNENNEYNDLQITFTNGTTGYTPEFQFLATAASTCTLKYYGVSGAVTLASGLSIATGQWWEFTFDYDISNNKILNCTFAGTQYTINATPQSAANTTLYDTLMFGNKTASNNARSVWMDELLVRYV